MLKAVEVNFHAFLASGLDEIEQAPSFSRHFIPWKKSPIPKGGWVSSRDSLDAVAKIEIAVLPEIESRPPRLKPVTLINELSWLCEQ
jgi:hypothetical protein